MAGALGRIVPPDWQHIENFPLTAMTFPVRPTPAVIGVNWYPHLVRMPATVLDRLRREEGEIGLVTDR